MKFIAFTVKGLEKVTSNELESSLGASVISIQDKVVIFEYEGDTCTLNKIKTADDIGLLVSTSPTIPSLESFLNYIQEIRHLTNKFSITLSTAKSNISKEKYFEDLKLQIEGQGLSFSEYDRSNLDFRIFANEDSFFIAIRLFTNPLSFREHDTFPYIGALKNSIAGSMVYLSTFGLNKDLSKNLKVVDIFCGSGTILAEAKLLGLSVYGSDISYEAISITKKRMKLLGETDLSKFQVYNATNTKWQKNSFDIVISNLPWDQKHEIQNISELYSLVAKELRRIVKFNFRLCVICHKPELFQKYLKKEFGEVGIQRLDLGYLGQNPSILFIDSLYL